MDRDIELCAAAGQWYIPENRLNSVRQPKEHLNGKGTDRRRFSSEG